MSPLISLDTDESLRWSTGLERISAATPVIAEWGRTGRCGGAGRIAESWQHCVEIWVERGAGCSGLRGPSCRAVSHVACAGRGAVATFGRHLRGCMVPYGRGRAPTQRPGTGNGTEVWGERLCTLLLWCRCVRGGDPVTNVNSGVFGFAHTPRAVSEVTSVKSRRVSPRLSGRVVSFLAARYAIRHTRTVVCTGRLPDDV